MNSYVDLDGKALVREIIPAVEIKLLSVDSFFIDFGKAAFGTIRLGFPLVREERHVRVHLGESLNGEGRLERNPRGSIQYRSMSLALRPGVTEYTAIIPSDERNTGPMAIPMAEEIGEVMPFRYGELENCPPDFTAEQLAVHYPFDEEAARFGSSDDTLNAVWDICKYTIKATLFCGLYVDGDRERIPYEGDAYLNQLSHYCLDSEYAPARLSQEYLFDWPTWPTEWQFHAVFMAWADWMYTGDREFLERHYPLLRQKTLVDLAREDGLISTESPKKTREFEESLNLYHDKYIYGHGLRDLVDWPPGSFNDSGVGERDNHEMMPVNSVINAFHYRAIVLLSRIAEALGKGDDSRFFRERAVQAKEAFRRVFLDRGRLIYRDGEGSSHSSLHSNMYALAFGLVDDGERASVLDFVKSRGMACSVYGAQYLLEALYLAGEEQYALELMTARHDRSWWNMIASGSTMTLEAWDWKYKNNLDWNHAWGAAPANIIPRYLMGIRPLAPGYARVLIKPQPGSLVWAECTCPTLKGPVSVRYEKQGESRFLLTVHIPAGSSGRADLRYLTGDEASVHDDLPPGEYRFSG
jgi:alpha-L-rhamnosidase